MVVLLLHELVIVRGASLSVRLTKTDPRLVRPGLLKPLRPPTHAKNEPLISLMRDPLGLFAPGSGDARASCLDQMLYVRPQLRSTTKYSKKLAKRGLYMLCQDPCAVTNRGSVGLTISVLIQNYGFSDRKELCTL